MNVRGALIAALLASAAPGARAGDPPRPPKPAPPKVAPPAPPPAPISEGARKGRDLLERGRVEEAEAALREALAARTDDVDARVTLGDLLEWDGRPAEADRAWWDGVAGKEAEVPLLKAVARALLKRGAAGPGASFRRGASLLPEEPREEEAAAFLRARRESALDAIRKAAALRPGDREVALLAAELPALLGHFDESAKRWEEGARRFPKDGEFLAGWGGALLGLGRKEEARAKCEAGVKLAPRSPRVHDAEARVLEATGRADEAKLAHCRAFFFDWLPPFSRLEFSEDAYRKVFDLAADPDSEEKVLDAVKARARKRALVDEAAAAKDDASWQLLEAVCGSHCAHGETEDAAFAALEARGKPSVPALMALLRDSPNTCVAGAAARALGRMREGSAFDLLVRKLPGDVGAYHPMDVAGALGLLGDPRAVPHLLAILDADGPPSRAPRVRRKPDPPGFYTWIDEWGGAAPVDVGIDARWIARGRAALALGEFDLPEARAAIEKGCANPELAGFCHAVLWRITKDEAAHGKPVAALVNGDDPGARDLVGRYLERVDSPNARHLVRQWKNEKDE